MKRISAIKSLLMFNERILSESKLENKYYDINEIKEKLFFNQIFINNMMELFMKYKYKKIFKIKNQYVKDLSLYSKNIKDIINYMKFHYGLKININKGIAFNTNLNEFNYKLNKFENNHIYYIANINNCIKVFESTKSSIIKKGQVFYKEDLSIIESIKSKYNTSSVAVFKPIISDITNDIIKVEFNSANVDYELFKIFPSDTLLITNPFLYIDDINNILDSLIPKQKPRLPYNQITIEEIIKKDVIVSFPDISFDAYLNFIEEAANSEFVSSIYITIYRIGKNNRLFNILKKAVTKGKTVFANVELNAYGEKINKYWQEKMISSGINVINYGYSQMKIHAKLTLIVLKNKRLISQIGTGNYNDDTAKQYTDFSMFSSRSNIGKAVAEIFKSFSKAKHNTKITNEVLITQYNFKKVIKKLIDNEVKQGEFGYIAIKCNGFDDKSLFKKLNKAAKKKCKIQLIVRGLMTWIPKNDNISVRSIIWDKLEHSRIYVFGRKFPTVFIGSLDPIKRKIKKRIEVLVQIKDPEVISIIMNYMENQLSNIKDSWFLTNDGRYIKES